MRFPQSFLVPILLGVVVVGLNENTPHKTKNAKSLYSPSIEEFWHPPSSDEIPKGPPGDLIRYGKELIINTSHYLGPKGIVKQISNNLNCQNCHLAAGTQNFGNPFSAVASTYPKFRNRSGRIESIEFRINECLQRSLNGEKIDSSGKEMRAIVAYMKWVGKNVPHGISPPGSAAQNLKGLNRAADNEKGKRVYGNHCRQCHGQNGEGLVLSDSTGYIYPPLWGDNSYNISAGMYQLSKLASFIKNNMPGGVTWKNTRLTDEEAWDVAAFISAQYRPVKFFSYDWPDISKKPMDYPFGPYADSFSQTQHKYGPYLPMQKINGISTIQ